MCVSGGVNSTTMMSIIYSHNDVYEIDRFIFADTGLEYPEMYEYLDTLRDKGFPIETVSTDQRFDDWFYGKITRGERKGIIRGFPPVTSPCYWMREAKFNVLKKECKDSICMLGYSADEESRVNGKHDYGYKCYFPLWEWGFTQEMCVKYLQHKDLWNPLYDFVDRTGCWLCPKQSKKSLLFLKTNHPDLWDRLLDYQRDDPVGFHTDDKRLISIENKYTSLKFQRKLTGVMKG